MDYINFWLKTLNDKCPQKETTLKEAARYWYVSNTWEVSPGEPKEFCICGQPIVECNEITNKLNGCTLSPIGSKCIELFNNSDLNYQSKWKLLFSVYREPTPETKFGLKGIINDGAIEYAFNNNWISDWEFKFMLKMLKKRKYSEKQTKQIIKIIYIKIRKRVKDNMFIVN